MRAVYLPTYMIAYPIVTQHIANRVRQLRFRLRRKISDGILIPSFDHVTFDQPFVASYEEATKISFRVELAALRLSMGDHIFTLGEAKFFESRKLDTLYLEVTTDEEAAEFLKRVRSGLFSTNNVFMLGPKLDDRGPKLHVTLFQGKDIAKKSKRLLRDVDLYNQSLKETRVRNKEQLVVFRNFIPGMYAKYRTGWRVLGQNPMHNL